MACSVKEAAMDDPLLSEIAHHTIHEGDRYVMVRQDGSSDSRSFTPIEATAEITTEAIRKAGFQAIHRAKEQLADQLRASAGKMMIEIVKQATDETGNTVDAEGRPPTAELLLDTLDQMELSFESDGTWRPPQFVGHESLADRFASEIARLETHPALKARLNALVERQREEWRVREANRKLVD